MADDNNRQVDSEQHAIDPDVSNGASTDGTGHGRRTFLGASALGLAALGLGGTAAANEGPQEGHPEFATAEHDHSGEHGATSRLGDNAPVESITVKDLRTKDKPVTDVRAYGAVGDGETDDYEAIQTALDEIDDDALFFPPGEYICGSKLTYQDEDASLSLLGGGRGVSEIRFTGDEGGIDLEFSGEQNGFDPQKCTVRSLSLRTTGEHDAAISARWPEYDQSTQNAMATIRDVELDGPWESGVHLSNAWNSIVDDLKVRGRWAPGSDQSTGSVVDLDGWCVDTTVSNVLVYGFHTGVSIDDVAEGVSMARVTLVLVEKGFDLGAGLYFTLTDSHVNGYGNGPILDVEGASEVYVSGCLLWNLFGENEKEPVVRYAEGAEEAVGNANGLKIENTRLNGTSGGLSATGATEVTLTNSSVGFVGPSESAVHLDDVDKVQIVNNFVNDAGTAVEATALYNARIAGNTFDTAAGVNVEDGINNVVSDNLVYEDVQYLVRQENNNNVPENAHEPDTQGLPSIAETYGQSFTVPQGFSEIEVLLANYGNEDSAFTMTLYEGSPADGNLTKITSERVEGFPDNAPRTFELGADAAGTYYLEMSDPDGTPTWWWHEAGSPDAETLADVGGEAFVDRQTVDEADLGREVAAANFIIAVPR